MNGETNKDAQGTARQALTLAGLRPNKQALPEANAPPSRHVLPRIAYHDSCTATRHTILRPQPKRTHPPKRAHRPPPAGNAPLNRQ